MRTVVFARIAPFALICSMLFGGCQSLQDIVAGTPKPTAHVIGASIRGLSSENVVLLFDLQLENPYAVNLPLADLHYSLASSGTKFAEGSVQPTGSIPARGKQIIQLPVTVQFASLFAALKGVKAGALVPYTADVKIAVDAPVLGRVDVPLSKSGEFPVPTAPQVQLDSFAVGKLGLDQVTASAKLQIKNTNQFALDLTKLSVLFALGGLDVGSSKVSNSVKLPAGQAVIVQIPLSFSPRAAGIGIVNLLKGDQIAYQVSGSIDANTRFGPLALPFSHIGNTKITR